MNKYYNRNKEQLFSLKWQVHIVHFQENVSQILKSE